MLTHTLFFVKYQEEVVHRQERKDRNMAKTKSSQSGKQQKKIVPVKGYTKSDGTKVSGHRRSTPN